MSDYQDLQGTRVTRAVLSWVDFYSRSVPSGQSKARREELISDLHEQYAAGARSGLSPMAVSRSVIWRALRGVPADLRWGKAHHYGKRNAMGTTKYDRESRDLFHGMNVLWVILAAAFIVGIGATIADNIVRDDVLGVVMFGNIGFPTSSLLVLTSMAVFPLARVAQLIGHRLANQQQGPQDGVSD